MCLVHNNLSVTQGFIDHLFANTKNFRLLFVDNGSEDKTASFLLDGQKDGKWSVIRSETNLGVIGGRNLGAKYIESDYFLNIDNDQYPGPGWLDHMFRLVDSGYDICGVEAWQMSPPNTHGVIHIGNNEYKRDYFPQKKCQKSSDCFTYVGCGGMLIKKTIYEHIGLFDEIFNPAYFEDPDFVFRALQNGYKIGWSYSSKINHLAHQTINKQKIFDKSKQFLKSWKLFYKKWYPYYPEPVRM